MAALVHFSPAQQMCFVRYQGAHCVDDVKLVFDELDSQTQYNSCFRFLIDLSLVTSCQIDKADLRLLQGRIEGYARALANPERHPLMLAYYSPNRAAREVAKACTGQWNLNRFFVSMTSAQLADCTLFLAVDPMSEDVLRDLIFDQLPRA